MILIGRKKVRGHLNKKQKLSDKTSTKKSNTRIHKTFKKSSCGRTPDTKKGKKKMCLKKLQPAKKIFFQIIICNSFEKEEEILGDLPE